MWLRGRRVSIAWCDGGHYAALGILPGDYMQLKRIVVALAAAGTLALCPTLASAQQTIDVVKKRGQLVCGVNGSLPGFSLFNAVREWEGLDVDYCRAVAAAVLGDASKVKFVTLTAQQRFSALAAGEVDMLARNSTVTLERVAGTKVRFAAVNYYDGQAFVVPKRLKIETLTALRNGNICVTKGTTHAVNIENWFQVRRLSVNIVNFDTQDAMYEGFFGSRCLAISQDATALAATLVRSGKAADHIMLPDIISKEPLGAFVRSGDEAWLDVVRWTHYAMLEAEEREITKGNVDSKRESTDPAVRRFLGLTPGNGKALGLDEAWAYNAIKQVGNYSESFERNVGARSPLGFGRGVNALWSKGGLMYPMPIR